MVQVVLAGWLLVVTALLGSLPSSVPVGSDAAPDPVQPGSQGWRVEAHGDAEAWRGPDGTVELRTHGEGSRAVAWHPLTATHPAGRWEVEAELLVPGRGRSVRLAVATPDPADPLWFGSYRIHSERWGTVPLTVSAPLAGRGAEVGLIVRGEGGVASLRRVDVVPVARHRGWLLGVTVVLVGWAGLAWTWRAHLGRRALAGLAVLAVGIGFPRPWLDRVFAAVVDAGWVEPSSRLLLQKGLGHVGLFGLLAAVLVGRLGPARTVALMAGLAVATELAQRLAVARSASLGDVAFDLVGTLVGVSLGYGISRMRPGSPD